VSSKYAVNEAVVWKVLIEKKGGPIRSAAEQRKESYVQIVLCIGSAVPSIEKE
jgi:hypothetical protein